MGVGGFVPFGTSNPLRELFDHGLDSWSTIFITRAILYLPRGYDFSVITSFLMYLITALYNINQSYKDVSENIEKKMRISFKNEFCFRELGRTTFLEAVRPLVSTLAEQVCLNCVMPSVTRLWILWTDSTFSMISSASSLLAEQSL